MPSERIVQSPWGGAQSAGQEGDGVTDQGVVFQVACPLPPLAKTGKHALDHCVHLDVILVSHIHQQVGV